MLPPSQSWRLRGSNTSINLLASMVLLEATDSLLTGSACSLLGGCSCCCTLAKYCKMEYKINNLKFCLLDNDLTHPLQQTRKRQMRRASRGSRPVVLVALEPFSQVIIVLAYFIRRKNSCVLELKSLKVKFSGKGEKRPS